MENPNKNAAGDNGGTAGTKLERLQLRARRLQQQAQQARERLREEESAQEKLARLLERRRIESEQRLLGGLAYIAGLSSFRVRSAGPTISTSQPLDADLLIGAMRLLYEQLRSLDDDDELQRLRSRGEALRNAYLADRSNPRLSMSLSPVSGGHSQGDNHE
jgi:hypothetical protein